MIELRDGTTTDDPRLDRLVSARTDHLDKYPLTAATLPAKATPMAAGLNWYTGLDQPQQRRINGRTYWVIGGGSLGSLRGGHAVCLRPWDVTDNVDWWEFYDQGVEGRCCEFAVLRVLSLLNRKRYDITSRWLYWQAQRNDEWAGGSYPDASPVYEGTSVRAALDVAKKFGAIPARPGGAAIDPAEAASQVRLGEGIAVYRWATNWADVRAVLKVPDWLPGVPMLNSWGRYGYPHEVILLDEAGDRLRRENGEFGVATDR
jgi:hypothetical protein